MRRICVLALIFLFNGPADLLADRSPIDRPFGVQARTQPVLRDYAQRLRRYHRLPVYPGLPGKPVHPIHPGDKPDHPGHMRPRYLWPVTTTVVHETQTIVIVNPLPAEEPAPPPEPQMIWIPPVMDTRTEPGYWDYGVKKVWMGDHWRFEQDIEAKTWVPETQVPFVKQAGYWKVAE